MRAVQGKGSSDIIQSEKLMKVGEIAKATGETISTIRFWTKEGLLDIADITESHYHLYSVDMLEQCKKIQQLKKQRLTINEIKSLLQK